MVKRYLIEMGVVVEENLSCGTDVAGNTKRVLQGGKSVSFKRNILASYVTQIYVTLIGILILPMYLKYMGTEAYGLVGFFAMLQALFALLDMGLTPTVARETARFNGGATDALSYRRLLRALQVVFTAVAIIGGGLLILFSGLISDRWLNLQTLPRAQVQFALSLMGVGVALRWMSGLYKGCISGAEQLVWLGGFNAIAASLRFVGVLPVLAWVGNSPAVFFSYQLIVAAAELIALGIKAHSKFPPVQESERVGFSPALLILPIKPILKYSLTIAFTSSVWILVTQIDKLVLSGILPLSEYGYFTLAVLLASGIMTLCAPLTNPLTLRMIRLYAEGKTAEAFQLYCISASLISIVAGSISILMLLFPHEILMAWTGNESLAREGSIVLGLYAGGYFFCALGAFPGYIQQASGDLRYHLRGNLILFFVMAPLICGAAYFWGAAGAAITWLAVNFLYFFFWAWFTHAKLLPGIHEKWILDSVVRIVGPGVALGLALKFSFNISEVRLLSVVELFFCWVAVLAFMFLFSAPLRAKAIKKVIGLIK